VVARRATRHTGLRTDGTFERRPAARFATTRPRRRAERRSWRRGSRLRPVSGGRWRWPRCWPPRCCRQLPGGPCAGTPAVASGTGEGHWPGNEPRKERRHLGCVAHHGGHGGCARCRGPSQPGFAAMTAVRQLGHRSCPAGRGLGAPDPPAPPGALCGLCGRGTPPGKRSRSVLVFGPEPGAGPRRVEDQLRADAGPRLDDLERGPLADELQRAWGRQRPCPPPRELQARAAAEGVRHQDRPGGLEDQPKPVVAAADGIGCPVITARPEAPRHGRLTGPAATVGTGR